MLPGEEIIHVLPQEFKIDGQSEIKEPIGMYGGRLEVKFSRCCWTSFFNQKRWKMYSKFWY